MKWPKRILISGYFDQAGLKEETHAVEIVARGRLEDQVAKFDFGHLAGEFETTMGNCCRIRRPVGMVI